MTRRDAAARRPAPGPGVIVVLLLAAAAGVWWLSAHRPRPVDVFFVRADPAQHHAVLVAVPGPVASGSVERRLDAALRALLAGPRAPGARAAQDVVSEIPAGTMLRGVRVEDGTAVVDLSRRYASGGGSTSMLARVWQVVYTATQFPEARAAQITIEGRRVEWLGGEGVPIGRPLDRSRAPAWF